MHLLRRVCRKLEMGGRALHGHILALLAVRAKVTETEREELARRLELRAGEYADALGGDMADSGGLRQAEMLEAKWQ